MGKVIGIDLGTTNSCVAVLENGEPVIIPNSSGGRTTPSVVAFTKIGERLVGEAAKRQAVTNPDRTFVSIKRQMGTRWTANVDGTIYKPQMISAMILSQLKSDAEDFTGETITDAVITVPAYFNDAQRQATKDAGKIAGLNVLRIINEPTSAALSYGLNHGASQKVLVYDLGGGTFDVSVIEMGDDTMEVLATNGNNHLGGDDFDKRVAEWMVQNFRQQEGVDLSRDVSALQRVREAAEQAKKELSTLTVTEITLPYIAQKQGQPVHLSMRLDRATFENLIRDLLDSTAENVRNALSDAGISAKDLGRIILVGGSTRIPAVHDKIRQITGMEPSQNINPDECVAAGAAIMGSIASGNQVMVKGGSNELLLFDVIPMSLSIETVGGVATVLIERNSTIPTKYSRTFYATSPLQRMAKISVYQGERPLVRDNKKIGEFMLTGLRAAASGIPQIDVTFDIDVNGILTVSAQDERTGKQKSITITSDERMTDAEIEKARRDAAAYADLDSVRVEAMELERECRDLLKEVYQKEKALGRNMDRGLKKEIAKDQKDLEKLLSKLRLDQVTKEQIAQIADARDRLRSSSGRM